MMRLSDHIERVDTFEMAVLHEVERAREALQYFVSLDSRSRTQDEHAAHLQRILDARAGWVAAVDQMVEESNRTAKRLFPGL